MSGRAVSTRASGRTSTRPRRRKHGVFFLSDSVRVFRKSQLRTIPLYDYNLALMLYSPLLRGGLRAPGAQQQLGTDGSCLLRFRSGRWLKRIDSVRRGTTEPAHPSSSAPRTPPTKTVAHDLPGAALAAAPECELMATSSH